MDHVYSYKTNAVEMISDIVASAVWRISLMDAFWMRTKSESTICRKSVLGFQIQWFTFEEHKVAFQMEENMVIMTMLKIHGGCTRCHVGWDDKGGGGKGLPII